MIFLSGRELEYGITKQVLSSSMKMGFFIKKIFRREIKYYRIWFLSCIKPNNRRYFIPLHMNTLIGKLQTGIAC